MDQTTFLLPVISVCFWKVIPSHVSPDPAGLHSTTFIKPVVSSAGTLQGSKSQQLYFKFLFCLLKHFLYLNPPSPKPQPVFSQTSAPPFMLAQSLHSLFWLHVAALITLKTLVLAHMAVKRSAALYLQAMVIHMPMLPSRPATWL